MTLRLKLLCRSALRLVKLARLLPCEIGVRRKDRRQQMAQEAAETERLDRIRNPSDYLGKG